MTTTAPVMASAPPDPPSALARMWLRAPGWAFHGIAAAGALAWLWSRSVPGIALFLWAAAVLVIGATAFVWFVRLVALLILTRGRGLRRTWWRFAIAPVAGVLVATLVVLGVPLEARWAHSQPAFESIVDDLPPPDGSGQPEALDVPSRIGTYRITSAFRQDGAVVFFEANGAFIDDAGFAYLPDGPDPGLANGSFENPQFEHLSGPWYTWTASW